MLGAKLDFQDVLGIKDIDNTLPHDVVIDMMKAHPALFVAFLELNKKPAKPVVNPDRILEWGKRYSKPKRRAPARVLSQRTGWKS